MKSELRLQKKAVDLRRKEAQGSLQRRKNYDREVKRGLRRNLYNKPSINVRLSRNLQDAQSRSLDRNPRVSDSLPRIKGRRNPKPHNV